MQRFDCLSIDCPLFGPHLLEASAGTGKTFSIEHIFVRLILEGIELEEILAVTFTRAATRELKARIRSNLEKALHAVHLGDSSWQYLKPHFGSENAKKYLSDALALFDQCQIFTIHGFCFRMLNEFAFEAKVGTLLNSEENVVIPEALYEAASDFLEFGIDSKLLCTEQICLLFKEFESIEKIIDSLVCLKESSPSLCYSELFTKCKAALHSWQLDESRLLEDFRALENNFKKTVKGDFEGQIKALCSLEFFPLLLKEKGSLFDFLHPDNRKVRFIEPKFLHYPGFFDWAQIHIAPLVKQKVFPIIQKAFEPIGKKVLEEEDHFDPDAILLRLQKAIENPLFKECIRKKYSVAIIDEFQDTDAIQWDIFQKLFLDESLKALYLVGDPKQSIYRFRKADIYIYLKAKDAMGEKNWYLLDTNFRSSESLTRALNALFCREWFKLPQTGKTIPYHPVRAGLKIDSDFSDEKGSIHFYLAEGESLFEEAFLPYAVKEIERLSLKSCALLVKDRYQASVALDLLKKRGIPAVAKSHTPLGQTDAFRAILELFHAVYLPYDKGAANVVMAGPFAKPDLYLPEYKRLLEEKGLVPFAREFSLDSDAMQIFELLFEWERKEGFSFEGLNRFLKKLKNLRAEEGGRRRMEVDDEAVQIMTLHISKGLEFDVVFALGLATRTPKCTDPDELNAEKMRQLYVAMTRAKKRLYVPIAFSKKEPDLGTDSPIELFSKYFDGAFIDEIESLSKKESITLERLNLPILLGPQKTIKKERQEKKLLRSHPFSPSILTSFTSLAKRKEIEVSYPDLLLDAFTLKTMPRGALTGITIHSIFEKLFSSKKPIWRDFQAIDALVGELLHFSPLQSWKEAIQKMVKEIVLMPLEGEGEWFSLSEVDQFQVEMEFVFSSSPNFVKGFIDLVFLFKEKVYFLDWKTNWLENYEPLELRNAIDAHDYALQASLYSEAIRRHFKRELGGAFYIFIRGCRYLKFSSDSIYTIYQK